VLRILPDGASRQPGRGGTADRAGYSRAVMQRFVERDAKYSYSPDHASIGTVTPGEVFEVELVEGFGNEFASPADFTRSDTRGPKRSSGR
jgi:hypothetical protein